jgi:hypothetical protein
MRVAKDQVPKKIDVPGVCARQRTDFGDATGYGKIGGEYFTLAAGTDASPLLKGLPHDSCAAPHWGFMVAGEVVVTYDDGKSETCKKDDLFFWPAGHTVRVVRDAEIVLFSPQKEHGAVLDHMLRKMKG